MIGPRVQESNLIKPDRSIQRNLSLQFDPILLRCIVLAIEASDILRFDDDDPLPGKEPAAVEEHVHWAVENGLVEAHMLRDDGVAIKAMPERLTEDGLRFARALHDTSQWLRFLSLVKSGGTSPSPEFLRTAIRLSID
jgi:hypothetical protein